MENKKVLTIGEPMGLFIALQECKLEDVQNFFMSIAGAEYNVSVGLTRLGLSVGYLTKLGNDPFGKKILKEMEKIGIDTSMTKISNEYQTGFMLKAKNTIGDPDIFYYRKNSAASKLSVDDVKDLELNGWDALHITGVFPGISEQCYEATSLLMDKANDSNVPIFFDPNLRPQLWKSEKNMVENINRLAIKSDYFLPGTNEGLILCGSKNPDVIAEYYIKKGIGTVIVKTGEDGAVAYTSDSKIKVPGYKPKNIIDTVGAGDGFAVGVESGILRGLTLEESVRRGNAIGAIQIMNASDNEGLPTEEELEEFMNNSENVINY